MEHYLIFSCGSSDLFRDYCDSYKQLLSNHLSNYCPAGNFIALALGLYALIIFLYWNAVVVMRKEGRSLGNLLTLLLAIGLTLLLIYNFF